MYNIRENEHQELFYLDVDPLQPVEIHIPSPLGPLGYYVFVRVPAEAIPQLDAVSVKVDVGGLREDHHLLAPGQGVTGKDVVPSKEQGKAWRCMGRMKVSRGDGELNLIDWPAGVTQADVLLCTWPRFVESGMADDWITGQKDPLWAPSGVPLGGIGCGRVDICRDGRFRSFSMNNNQDAPVEDPEGLPGAYLAVSLDGVTKDLASRPIVEGHEACGNLKFAPRFPQAVLSAQGIFPGIDAKVTLSGTLCPHDLERSAIPGVIVRWELTNSGATDASLTCRMGWPNLIGIGGGIAAAESGIGYGDGFYHHWDDPTGRTETKVELDSGVAVSYTGNPDESLIASQGEHLLAVVRENGVDVGCSFGNQRGEVTAEVTMPAGGTASATMILVAAMPHWIDSLGSDCGHYWQNNYENGREIIKALIEDADYILKEAGALAELLDDSTLPGWLSSRLTNCNYPLVTNSVLYKDGRFSINEGPTEMAGCYGTIDQRLAAHPATQLLFPELNSMELSQFAAIQGKNGGITHDLGYGHLERQQGEMPWPDLTCSFIIQTARQAWSTGDEEFEKKMWPRAKNALIRHAEWAEEGRGVAQVGNGLGTSYDGYHYFGTTGYMATLWLAALAVCEKWAKKQGDTEILGDIERWRNDAIARIDHDLWNGKHYIAYSNGDGIRRDTCHGGQLAGQVYTRLLCGENVLEEERMRSCIDSIMNLNGSDRFVVPPDEVSPDGEAATSFGWLPYLEGFMLSAIASLGDNRVWPLWERMIGAVENDGKTPCDTRLMYRPNGEPSWGSFYMTAPASWLVYDAALDFFYSAANSSLRLRTTMPGRFPVVHPLFWATADVSENGEVVFTVRRVFSDEPVSVGNIEVASDIQNVEIEGVSVSMGCLEGEYRCCAVPNPIQLKEGSVLRWRAS